MSSVAAIEETRRQLVRDLEEAIRRDSPPGPRAPAERVLCALEDITPKMRQRVRQYLFDLDRTIP